MPDSVKPYVETLRDIDAKGALEILVIAVLFYALLTVLRGTTAMSLLRGGVIVFIALYVLANAIGLTVLNQLLNVVLVALPTAIAVIFQPEIRRTLERVGRTRMPAVRARPALDAVIEAVVGGCRELSRQRHGALMVLERETGLEDYISTGRRLDAAPTAELLAAIFYRNSPLHDGALVIRGDRIVAAGCTLPLTEAPLEGHVGTRHKAGIGVTERTDAVSVIVSEETGEVSIASNGRLVTKLDEPRLRALLATLLGQDSGGTGGLRWPAGTRLLGRAAVPAEVTPERELAR